MKTTAKKQRRENFKEYLQKVASQQTESGNDTFQRLVNILMSITSASGLTHRKYLMKYNKLGYRHFINALKANMVYATVNKKGYGEHSWLNCNNTNYIK